jgi:hypothetical protein
MAVVHTSHGGGGGGRAAAGARLAREFCVLHVPHRDDITGQYAVACHSVHDARVPPGGPTRATLHASGWVLRPGPGGAASTECTFVFQAALEPGGAGEGGGDGGAAADGLAWRNRLTAMGAEHALAIDRLQRHVAEIARG